MLFYYGKLIINKSSSYLGDFVLYVAIKLVQMADAAQDNTIKTNTQNADKISKEEFKRRFYELAAQHQVVINFVLDKWCNY